MPSEQVVFSHVLCHRIQYGPIPSKNDEHSGISPGQVEIFSGAEFLSNQILFIFRY